MADPIPISIVAEYVFCPRSAWLAFVTGAFQANEFTVEGEILHRKVHTLGQTHQGGRRQWRKVPLCSRQLGVVGYADLVEEIGGNWVVVEYKRGRALDRLSDKIQLCLQAMCVEEMTGKSVPEGQIYYATSRRRIVVPLTPPLRHQARYAVQATRELLALPSPPSEQSRPHCRGCAQSAACLAGTTHRLRAFRWEDWWP